MRVAFVEENQEKNEGGDACGKGDDETRDATGGLVSRRIHLF